ncbi:hypothetical protein N9112_00350 [bacterium]|nr:hypothetical protein [bacterium]
MMGDKAINSFGLDDDPDYVRKNFEMTGTRAFEPKEMSRLTANEKNIRFESVLELIALGVVETGRANDAARVALGDLVEDLGDDLALTGTINNELQKASHQ